MRSQIEVSAMAPVDDYDSAATIQHGHGMLYIQQTMNSNLYVHRNRRSTQRIRRLCANTVVKQKER